jgi:hypothetical protein
MHNYANLDFVFYFYFIYTRMSYLIITEVL